MSRTGAGVWLAPALCVIGSSAVAVAIWRHGEATRALLAAAGGAVAGLGLARLVASWRLRAHPALARPLDFSHALDLLRRAYAAHAAWLMGLRSGPLEALREGHEIDDTLRTRGTSIVELASVDGREHVVRDDAGIFIAIGDFPYAGGLLLIRGESQERVAAALDDLRQVIAGMRASESRARDGQGQVIVQQLALGAAGAQTFQGIARAGADLAEQTTQRPAMVVAREEDTGVVAAVSPAGDKRLAGLRLPADGPVGRAMQTGVPVMTHGADDLFGAGALPGLPDRRRRARSGAAYPLFDGRVVIGALVLTGPPLEADSLAAERVRRLALELGPRLAAAKAVHDAKRRAVLDPLTGLANRAEFERVVADYRRDAAAPRSAPATLVYVDLDFFKKLNDSLGHAAGDAALRHVARVLEDAVRDCDLVARIGGEEFAVWLPDTPLPQGWEVAERIRESVDRTAWMWGGSQYPLTTSCGVASYPDPIRDLMNLAAAADAALYRAKQAGRNRVEKASSGC